MSELTTDDFNFDLPEELIAQKPALKRDSCRLLHLDRQTGHCSDKIFTDLTGLLRPGDLLVLNDTRVIPSRFFSRRQTGGKIEGLFLETLANTGDWLVLLKGANRCKVGEKLILDSWQLELLENRGGGEWLLRASPQESPEAILQQVGITPLPPYIHRDCQQADTTSDDREDYQTVYARESGAVAAPTAGLHFTDELLSELAAMGVDRTFVTLHVGLGTFLPVTAKKLTDHDMHSERYEISQAAADKINATKAAGGRIVAVGTTAVRVLETIGAKYGQAQKCSGRTDIFIYPPYEYILTDALITNFHLPASTLVMLVAALCTPGKGEGREMILNAYQHAIEQEYRFYSYGDAMLIS